MVNETIYIASGEPKKGAELTKQLRELWFDVINPWENQSDDVFKTDLELVKKSNRVVVIMPNKGWGFGIIVEATYAWMNNIPVYFITNKKYKEPKFMKGIAKGIFWKIEDLIKNLPYNWGIDDFAIVTRYTGETWEQFWGVKK